MKQLYNVELTNEIIVLAESREEAERMAIQVNRNGYAGELDATASEMTYYPGDWDQDSIPFGLQDDADPDRSVAEWIKLGAAPNYHERKK